MRFQSVTSPDAAADHTMRFGSTTRVLVESMLRYYRMLHPTWWQAEGVVHSRDAAAKDVEGSGNAL